MPTAPHIETLGPFELDTATKVLAVIPVANYTNISIWGREGGGAATWTGGTPAVIGVKWCNSPDANPADFATAVNITDSDQGHGQDASDDINVSRVAYVVLQIDTAKANAKAYFDICLTDNRGT